MSELKEKLARVADWQEKPLTTAWCASRSFAVLFYMKWPGRISSLDRGDLKMIYATRYCFIGSTGYVYLPGPTEPYFGENNGTIMRPVAEGNWHIATPAWNSLLTKRSRTMTNEPQYKHV